LKDGRTEFTATIDENNAGYLDGYVLESSVDAAHLSSSIQTVPLTYELWHRRFAHHSVSAVQKLVKDAMVDGLSITDPGSKPDPICEPCLAGKMVANPSTSSNNRTSIPLHRIHSDLHDLHTPTAADTS